MVREITPTVTVTVSPAVADQVAITSPPWSLIAGTRGQMTVQLEDTDGNPVVSISAQTINLTTTSTVGAFYATQTSTTPITSVVIPAGDSSASLYYSDTKAGTPTVKASDTALSSAPTQLETINPAAAQSFKVTTSFLNPDMAGAARTVTVTALDVYFNVVGSGPDQYEGAVQLSSTDRLIAGLPASYTFTFADAGSHIFTTVRLATAGKQTITATDSVDTTITSTSAAVTVVAAAARQLVIDIPPFPTVTAGTPLTNPIVIDEEDPFGNIVTSDNTTKVTASLASGAGTLDGTKQVTVSGGIASFDDLEDDTAGTLSLQFSAASLPLVISSPSIVTPAAASTFIIKRPPTGVISGSAFALEVDAQDPYRNLATSFNGPVTVADGVGKLSGTVTMTAKNGVADFTNLIDTGSGAITLSASGGGLTTGTSGGTRSGHIRPHGCGRILDYHQPVEPRRCRHQGHRDRDGRRRIRQSRRQRAQPILGDGRPS